MGIAAKIGTLPDADRRHALRSDYGRLGTLRVGDAPPAEVIVEDLCRDGCRILTMLPLVPNMRVSIGLAGVGLIDAEVLWHGSQGYGCAFVERLPAGSITAAFSPTNVHRLTPSRGQPDGGTARAIPSALKWPIAWRIAAILLFSAVCWTIMGATLYSLWG